MNIRTEARFDRHEGDFLLSHAQPVGDTAREVMGEANALFPVTYPAACWQNRSGLTSSNYDGEHVAATIPRVESGAYEGQPLHKYVLRTDTEQVLGLHSCKYSETDGYNPIADMAEELFPNSSTACTVFGAGERVALTQQLTEPVDLGDGDIIKPQICWISSLNGTWRTAVYALTERLFCQNQLVGQMPLVRVKHTKNHDHLLEMRIRILEGSIARAKTVSAMARVLRDQEYSDEQFDRLVSQILPVNHTEMTERQANIVLTRLQYCRGAWYKEKEEFWAGIRWLAYNAVQGAEQHRINGRVRGGQFSRDRALEKAIDQKTPLAEKALALLSA